MTTDAKIAPNLIQFTAYELESGHIWQSKVKLLVFFIKKSTMQHVWARCVKPHYENATRNPNAFHIKNTSVNQCQT